MAHYYTNNTDLKSQKNITFQYRNQDLTLSVYRVFSKSILIMDHVFFLKVYILPSQKSLLDVGCGYGTLGLSLKVYSWIMVEMVDVNERFEFS
ncbi:MAG: methyltransferase [Coprobacillus cateniformis]|uniref:methyltransferase n=1 Tax=Coprobacillus cateniformis TaxID=100884 RepID=UPI003990B384